MKRVVRSTGVMAVLLLITSHIYGTINPPQLSVPGDENWGRQFGGGGLNGFVADVAAFGNDIIVVGSFTRAGQIEVDGLARWDGQAWHAVGHTSPHPGYEFDGNVNAVAVQGNNIYVGGSFTTAVGVTANGIAKWDGSEWSALGTGINTEGHISTIKINGSDVYIGGVFTSAGGVDTYGVAKWDGSTWSGFGSDLFELDIEAIEFFGSDLYAGGQTPYNISRIKKWTGSRWSDVGDGLDGNVYALATDGDYLYAGGEFTDRIARWDGSAWSAVGGGVFHGIFWDELEERWSLDSKVTSVIIDGNDLYVSGWFEKVGGVNINGIAKWNGSAWSGFEITNCQMGEIFLADGKLYAIPDAPGGIGDLNDSPYLFAVWDGSRWSSLGNGLNGIVYALASGSDGVYAGGCFTNGGGIDLDYIGKWDGTRWHAVGSGMNHCVYAVAVEGSELYTGGYFTEAGGMAASHIARWDGSAWHALGNGLDGSVYAIAVNGNDVYAGGDFTEAGGTSASHIAHWDGSTWHALGNGVNSTVYAIAVNGNDVYAGGDFTEAGGTAVNYLAQWNGSAWSPLGSGVYGEVANIEIYYPSLIPFYFSDPRVMSMVFHDGNLYAGGYFTTADGAAVNHIARWDGSEWHNLGSGFYFFDPVFEFYEFEHAFIKGIAVSGNSIYAGGLTESGYIQQWKEDSWANMGSGCNGVYWDGTESINGRVEAICSYGDDVYVGGRFDTAGGKQSNYIAVWHASGGTGPDLSRFTEYVSASGPVVSDGGSSFGCAWEDYNNDGHVDLFVANDLGEDNFLYENNGDGTFTRITSGDVVTDGGVSWSGSWSDYDNDGNTDLFVTDLVGANRLYHNNGDGTFTKITSGEIISTTASSRGCSWCDYNQDGHLDLFVANGNDQDNFLFNNNGDGTFTRVTDGPVVTDGGYSTSGIWSDMDLDSDMDLFVTNTSGQNNCLYINNGDGTFTKAAEGCLVTDGGESWTASWGDMDNDGDMDLFVGNNSEANFFYVNKGDGTFSKVTSGIVITGADHSRSSAWGDVNNDGHLDLIVSNRNENSYVYLNEGGGSFARYYTASANSRGVGLCDYDADGDMDLCAVNDGADNFLYKNLGNGYHWVHIRCRGTLSNRSAIGARVAVLAAIRGTPVWQTRIIGSQTGFGGENHLAASFGLRDAETIDTLKVWWPSGQVTVMVNLAADQQLAVTEAGMAPPVFLDDFNDNVWCDTLWQYAEINDAWAQEQNNRLELGVSGSVTIQVSSLFSMRGDFDIQIDFAAHCQESNGNGIGFSLTDGVDGYSVSRHYNSGWGTRDGGSGHMYFSNFAGVYSESGLVSTTAEDTTGRLRLTRAGEVITAYFDHNGSWEELRSASGSAEDIKVVLEAMAYGDAVSVTGWIDNFTVNQGSMIFPTETETEEIAPLPEAYALGSNYPNPFNPETCIPYALPEPAFVTVKIINLTGREIRTLIHRHQTAGWHEVRWDGITQLGSGAASGIYLVRLQTQTFHQCRKIILLK